MKKLYGALLASAVALCALTVQASANTVTIASQNGADFTVLPSALQAQPLLTAISGTVYNDITGSTPDVDRSPFENQTSIGGGTLLPDGGYGLTGWDGLLHYDAVQGGGSGYINTGVGSFNTMTMLWGSPDTYNSIYFCTGANGTGNCTLGAYVSGVLPLTYGHDLITFDTNFLFASVVFETGQNALEFADVTTGFNRQLLAPLPGTLPLFAGGLGLIGLLGARRKRKSAGVAA